MKKSRMDLSVSDQQLEKELKRSTTRSKSLRRFWRFFSSVLVIGAALVLVSAIWLPIYHITGESMEPTLKRGSIIYCNDDNKNLKKDDIITYIVNDKELVSHRIVKIEDDLIETKGDANNMSDPNRVHINDVKGKVQNITIPYVGYFINIINNNLIIFVPTFVIILILEFFLSNKEFTNIKNKDREEK